MSWVPEVSLGCFWKAFVPQSSPVLKRARKAFGTKGKDTNIPILLEILRKLDFLIK